MLLALVLAGGLAALPVTAQEQTEQNPGLHRRTASAPDGAPAPTVATGHTDLPPSAEGEYPWNKTGGTITIFFEEGKLHGYMSDLLSPDSMAAPVTFKLQTTHADGHALEWTTRTVHGRSFRFSGHLERIAAANAKRPSDYLLTGALTEHGGRAGDVVRTLSLKRAPAAP